MTLFRKMSERQYEISDVYIVATGFIISYWVTKIDDKTIKTLNAKTNHLYPNDIRGGDLIKLEVSDEMEMGLMRMSYIARKVYRKEFKN